MLNNKENGKESSQTKNKKLYVRDLNLFFIYFFDL